MTSRERVLAAINHFQPERVPIGLCFAPELEKKLREELGLNKESFWIWVSQDLVTVGARFPEATSEICYADPTIEVTKEGYFLDIFRVPFKIVETGFQRYVELAGKPPLVDCRSASELEDFPWPRADMWDYSHILEDSKAQREKAVWGHSRGFFEIAHFMRGIDNFLMDLAQNPGFACALMDHVAEYLLERTRLSLEAGKGQYVFFEYNDDVASQRGLFISPAMWRKYIKPRMARFCELIHGYGVKVQYHCCGSVYAIIEDLIEIGVDILNPVQPLAADMDPFELKKQFGERLCFHGAIDI